MKTIVLEQPEQLRRMETPSPEEPPPGWALVRVRRVGVCGTDLHAFRGRQPFFSYPRILGHELGVEVVQVNAAATTIKPGDRCAVEPYLNCGSCQPCRQGRTNCCEKLQVLGVHTDGGMRELIAVPANKLHRSAALGLDELALVEPLGVGAHAVDRAGVRPGEKVLVIGAGPIGLSVIQFAAVAGAEVMVMEVRPDRVDFCRRHFKIAHFLGASPDPAARLRGILGGELPAVVLDATGSPQSMMAAFRYAAHGGRLVFVGLFQGEVAFNDPEFHRRELTLLASRNSTARDFTRIIRLMEEGKVDTRPWITHRAGYQDLVEQFPSWLDPDRGVVKAMLEL